MRDGAVHGTWSPLSPRQAVQRGVVPVLLVAEALVMPPVPAPLDLPVAEAKSPSAVAILLAAAVILAYRSMCSSRQHQQGTTPCTQPLGRPLLSQAEKHQGH